MAHKATATGCVTPVSVGSRDRLAIINNQQATCIQDHLFKEVQAWFRAKSNKPDSWVQTRLLVSKSNMKAMNTFAFMCGLVHKTGLTHERENIILYYLLSSKLHVLSCSLV